jgi:hypothetical protein
VQRLLTKKKVAKVLLLPFLGLLQHFFGVDFDTKPCSDSGQPGDTHSHIKSEAYQKLTAGNSSMSD